MWPIKNTLSLCLEPMLVEVLENKGENILIEKLKLIVYFEDLLFYAILMTYTMV